MLAKSTVLRLVEEYIKMAEYHLAAGFIVSAAMLSEYQTTVTFHSGLSVSVTNIALDEVTFKLTEIDDVLAVLNDLIPNSQRLYTIHWEDSETGDKWSGLPIPKRNADFWVEVQNNKYPEVKHWAEPA